MKPKFGKYYIGDQKPIVLNIPQWLMILAPQKYKMFIGGRGVGKSTILGHSQKEKALEMPRCSLVLVGETYSQMLTRTLPSTIQGLELLGYKKNIHFFVGRKAPAKWKWDEAYQAPLVYDHAIHWISGSVTHLVSLDLKDSGRGINSDGVDGDEAAGFDQKRVANNVLATNRAGNDKFKGNPLHHAESFYSSMPRTNKGKWLFDYERFALEDPKNYFSLRASSEHNRHNLTDAWFANMKRTMTDYEYNTEILNIQPGNVEGGFYAQFAEEVHTYTDFNNGYLISLGHNYTKAQTAGCLADGDVQMSLPMDIAFDYGANINVIHAEQESDGVSRGLISMYIKTPFTIDVLVNNFCDYYAAKPNKEVFYHYDHTAVYKDAVRTVTFADVVIATFIKRGWTVYPIYHGQAPGHHAKKLFWEVFLKGEDSRLPSFKLNKHNCKHMVISIQNAGVVQGRNGFEKDKRPERKDSVAQEEATHFSDAADTLYYHKYGPRLTDSIGEYSLPSW
ncbi:MAG: hypothetical protein V4608_03350 [Bacteroidota bacterium]